MEKVRKVSVQEPIATQSASVAAVTSSKDTRLASKVGDTAAEAALRARVSRMGLLDDPAADIDGVVESIVQAGLCHGINQRWRRTGPNDPEQRQELLLAFHQLLEESPTPAGEWPGLREICGDELLGQILSISHASLRRYAAGERRCPDGVATRLHWLALVVEALEGSYNTIGIRRWFARPRQALAGATPVALLEGNWLPEHPGPQRLKALAAATQAGMVAS